MMEERLIALESSSQELLRGQKELRRDVKCIVETWQDFHGTYGEHLKLSVAREQERAKLRQAVIEKTTVGALWALFGFLAIAAWHQIQNVIK
jgi:hypothetical protein